MNTVLMGNNRAIVLDYLIREKVPLVLVAPNGGHLTLAGDRYSIHKGAVLFFVDMPPAPEVEIRFFYKGKGLCFYSAVTSTKNGFAALIPAQLYDLAEDRESHKKNISAKLYYSGVENPPVPCVSDQNFPGMHKEVWRYFSKKAAMEAKYFFQKLADVIIADVPPVSQKIICDHSKLLYAPENRLPQKEYLQFNACILENDVSKNDLGALNSELANAPSTAWIPLSEVDGSPIHTILQVVMRRPSALDLEDILQTLPVCAFLADPEKKESTIEGRLEPISILSVSDTCIGLGMTSATVKLEKNGSYEIEIAIPCGAIDRRIKVSCVVTRLYNNGFSGEKFKSAALCRFIHVKEEDRRFLYEQYYGRMYT